MLRHNITFNVDIINITLMLRHMIIVPLMLR